MIQHSMHVVFSLGKEGLIELYIGINNQKVQLMKEAVTDKVILGSELELEGAIGG